MPNYAIIDKDIVVNTIVAEEWFIEHLRHDLKHGWFKYVELPPGLVVGVGYVYENELFRQPTPATAAVLDAIKPKKKAKK